MSENLIFPIGFDLESGVEEAIKNWDKYSKELERKLTKRAISLRVDFDSRNLDNLDAVKKRLAQIKIEPITPETKQSIRELSGELKQLAKALEQVQKFSKTNTLGQQSFRNDLALAREARLTESLEIRKRRAALAEAKHAEAMKRSAAASGNLSKAYKTQETYVSHLIKRLAVYAGYHSIVNFLNNVRSVTAEFELQRVSLGAIIQDQERANELFSEIKSFALSSPLTILDLTTYTKQVAAYGIETDKLFETTKRLADISVGLGVDMSRATLFYGQVFATGYLRASELRQATEMGLPLVDKLAKKLEELNGKEYSPADVMDLISKRAISFELVEQVFKDMTSAGGEFYNMQVKQSQTLFGLWSKLGDAASMMYEEIGNSPSVNAAMKEAIELITSLMENWQNVGIALSATAAALGTYVVSMKNAAVAAKSLHGFTKLLALAHSQQLITIPKIVTSVIGLNNSVKLSQVLTDLHTKAVLRNAAATNVLTKGFWKLAAAMLANPWTLVAALAAAAGVAILGFASKTETAADITDRLNKSVASFKDADKNIQPLISSYEELSKKANRTEEEQRKLNDTTKELARIFPEAVIGVNEFTKGLEISIDKAKELNSVIVKARRVSVEESLTEAEEKQAEISNLIDKYEKLKKRGIGGFWDSESEEFIYGIAVSDKDVANRIVELSDEYDKLNKEIVKAKRALRILPSEEQETIDKFGAWKKTLQSFRQQVGDVRVSLFDDSTIAQFGSLNEALEKAAGLYKKNSDKVKEYDRNLQSSSLNADERAKIETEREEADTTAELAKNALEYYNALSLLNKESSRSGGLRKSDNRLQILQEIERTLTSIYNKYNELRKSTGKTAALDYVQKNYLSTLEYINKIAKPFDMNFAMPLELKDLQSYRRAIQGVIYSLGLKGKEKAVLGLDLTIGESNQDKLQQEIEANIKELADKVSRSKAAKEFYDKVLDSTGDTDLASKVAESIYGQNGANLQKALADQVKGIITGQNLEVPGGIISPDNIIDYKKLREFTDKYKDELGGMYKTLIQIADDGERNLADTFNGYLKELEKAKRYSDERIALARKTANTIAEINKSNLPKEQKEQLVAGYKEKEQKDAAKLEWDAFKEMPLYIQMFSDLDNASTSALTKMKDMLTGMQGAWKNLDPTQLKELQSRIYEINTELAKRNPFKTLSVAFEEYKKLREKYGSESEVNKKMDDAGAAYNQAKMELALQNNINPNDKEAVERAKEKVDATEEEYKNLQKVAEAYKEIKDLIGLSVDEVFQIAYSIGDLASGIGKITEVFGGSEEDVQYWNDIANGINEVTGGIENMTKAALSGNPLAIASSVITSVPKIISGFSSLFNAGKIKRANKEIARQQELLEQLEYTYSRLQEASDKLFGVDYINNYNQQIENLRAQETAYLKQAQAERSKGKKKDKEKIKEYEEAARETADKIKELEDDLVAHFTGQGHADAARQFAESWLEAKLSFANTKDAIKSDYQDLMKSMIVEGAAAKVIDNILEPMWKQMNEILDKDGIEGAFEYLAANMDSFIDSAANGLEVMWESLESKGYDLQKLLKDTDSSSTGIARDIATASEESINGLAAGINTQNYYISYVPKISEHVGAIRTLMETGNTGFALSENTGWTDWQQQAMDNFFAIQRNTAETVTECRRIAERCEALSNDIHKVIVPRGTKGSYGIQTYM